MCCGPFEVELGVDGADEGVSSVVGGAVGFSAIDDSKDKRARAKHIFAETVAWIEFFLVNHAVMILIRRRES